MRAWISLTLMLWLFSLPGCGSADNPESCQEVQAACQRMEDCCSGICAMGTCLCNPGPGAGAIGRCRTSADCCLGLGLLCQGGSCASGCRPEGDPCQLDLDCCSANCGKIGAQAGFCVPPCRIEAEPCASSDECCENLGCSGGVPGAATCSSNCKEDYFLCASDNECCFGFHCRAGTCLEGDCSPEYQRCAGDTDCCQSPLHLFCSQGDMCRCGEFAHGCLTQADCCNQLVCLAGWCHPPPGSLADGQACLDGTDCKSGTCEGAAPPQAGVCCTDSGGNCSVDGFDSRCCSPLACVGLPSAQTCGACLDWTNSGPSAAYACSAASQCCANQSLRCDATGKCCKENNLSCLDGQECCAGARCGRVNGAAQTTCCNDFGNACQDYFNPCCDGLVCSAPADPGGPYTCHRAPGQACTIDADCAETDSCFNDRCCSHDGHCTLDGECCSGSCGRVMAGWCDCASSYGQCQQDRDCCSRLYGDWPGPVCGITTPPNTCCPAPGDACDLDSPSCCEAGDLCQIPEYPRGGTTPRCCKPLRQSCDADIQCCSGSCHLTIGCCALLSVACTQNSDCCPGASGTVCGTSGGCCLDAGFPDLGDPSFCCSGNANQGRCK